MEGRRWPAGAISAGNSEPFPRFSCRAERVMVEFQRPSHSTGLF